MSRAHDIYDPATVDIGRLAHLLLHLSLQQREALAIRLDPEAMKQLEDSKDDIEAGHVVPVDRW